MSELGLSAAELARLAGVDASTVRALLKGRRWPNDGTRNRLSAALGWPPGEIARAAVRQGGAPIGANRFGSLSEVSTAELAHELCDRLVAQ